MFEDHNLVEFVNQYEADLHMTAVSLAYAMRSPSLSETLGKHADTARQNLLKLSGPKSRVSESPNVKKAQRGGIGGRSISKIRRGPRCGGLLRSLRRRNPNLA